MGCVTCGALKTVRLKVDLAWHDVLGSVAEMGNFLIRRQVQGLAKQKSGTSMSEMVVAKVLKRSTKW